MPIFERHVSSGDFPQLLPADPAVCNPPLSSTRLPLSPLSSSASRAATQSGQSYVTAGQAISSSLPATPTPLLPPGLPQHRRPILITTRALRETGGRHTISESDRHHDSDKIEEDLHSMRHHDDGKEFRTSFGRGGAGNLRRVSEAQQAHSLLLQIRHNSADVDSAAIARATPGMSVPYRRQSQPEQQQQQRRKSSSVSSSMSSMSSLFETLRRRVSSASSLTSLAHSSSRRHDDAAAAADGSGKRARGSGSFVVGGDDEAGASSSRRQDHSDGDVDVDVNADGVKLSSNQTASLPQASTITSTSNTDAE